MKSHILADKFSFVSKTFLIRFCDEEIPINSIYEFTYDCPIGNKKCKE